MLFELFACRASTHSARVLFVVHAARLALRPCAWHKRTSGVVASASVRLRCSACRSALQSDRAFAIFFSSFLSFISAFAVISPNVRGRGYAPLSVPLDEMGGGASANCFRGLKPGTAYHYEFRTALRFRKRQLAGDAVEREHERALKCDIDAVLVPVSIASNLHVCVCVCGGVVWGGVSALALARSLCLVCAVGSKNKKINLILSTSASVCSLARADD